ncbi:MAG: TfoX/Sxy family protein [Lacunisphaera sp.]|nr:TfoX/Sxy family protein [Lacunisphaera sp.]
MVHDAQLAARITAATKSWRGLAPRKMFGGTAWFLHGNMCVGIWRDSLVVRCGSAAWPALLKKRHVREMDITGRSMQGWLLVDAPALRTSAGLRSWLGVARKFAGGLPPK